jgi:type I restriction-modification system DNA methylase subunit
MQQKIKKLANITKKLIEEDIDNTLELMGFKNKDYFLIEDLISKKSFDILKNKIKSEESYNQILNSLVYSYYNVLLSLEILERKKIIHFDSENMYKKIRQASKKIPFFKLFDERLYIKLNTETIDELKNAFNDFEYWYQDDLMGWFYQFYNSDKKDMLSKSQIFTPHWVVKYMVDKSFQLLKDPINSKILDPACGSGNFLLYIYDVLKEIYLENGYSKNEAIKNIIQNNINGLDLDERAIQISEFLLTVKILEDGYDGKIAFNLSTPDENDIEIKTLGSLTPKKLLNNKDNKFVKILDNKYDLIIANPPYTDSREYSATLKEKIKEYYDDYKKNLYTCFITKNNELLNDDGVITMITPQTFMYISSYEKTRNLILNNLNIERFVHFGLGGVFDYALVDTALYILTKQNIEKSIFIDLTKVDKNKSKKDMLYNLPKNSNRIHEIDQNIFKKIPGKKFVYWLDKPFYKIFKEKKLSDFCDIRQGIATGNNKKYLRYHWEIPFDKININNQPPSKRWIPYVKGGPHRSWYGNYYWLISYDDKSKKELQEMGNHLPSKQYYFKEGITYTMTTSKGSTFRYLPEGMMFDCKGSSIFPKNKELVFFFLGLLNSKLTTYILKFLAGSVDLEVGDLKDLPVPDLTNKKFLINKITKISKKIYELKKQNMDFLPEELKNQGILKKLSGEHFEDMINKFMRKKILIDYKIIQQESLLNDMILDLYDLTNEKNILKEEFKDYIEIGEENSFLKLNYDIKKFKVKLSDNIARALVLEGYDINSVIKTIDKIDFSKNDKLAQEMLFLIVNELITEITENDDLISLDDDFLYKLLEKHHIDSFVTNDYHKKNIDKYLKKTFPKEHYKYFKKTPYIVLFDEPKSGFSVFFNTKKISILTSKMIEKQIDEYMVNMKNILEKEAISELIEYKKNIKKTFENYPVEKSFEVSNMFFEKFEKFLNY